MLHLSFGFIERIRCEMTFLVILVSSFTAGTAPPRASASSFDRWAVSQDSQSDTHSPDSPDSNTGDEEQDAEKTCEVFFFT